MVITDKLRRPGAWAAAALLVVASLVPLLSAKKANAYGLVTERYIKMSSSRATATDVNYEVSFKVATTGDIGGVVIEFCSTSPIIGDTCTAPTGFNAHAFTGDNTLVLSAQSGVTDFQKDLTDPDGAGPQGASASRVVLSRTGGAASVSAGTTVSVTLGSTGGSDGVTNPNGGTQGVAPEDNITFYGRILTFATAADAESYDSTAASNAVDAGGIALSTANQLTITAKVQERLTFCLYTAGTSCATGTGNSIILGDANGVLDSNTEYTNNSAKFSVSTNANGGVGGDAGKSVVIRLRGGTLKSTPGCADGSGQSCSINPVGNAQVDTAAGTEYFGLCVNDTGQTPLEADALYDGDSGGTPSDCDVATAGATGNVNNSYAFDDNNTTGTQSIYGQSISTMNAGTEKTGVLMFVGDIGATTEPGIYTTTLTFIATGTY